MPDPASCRRCVTLVAALTLLLSAAPAWAQGSLEITPFIASFYALTSVNEQKDVPLPDFGGTPPGSIVREQQDGPMIGVRVSLPVNGIIRAEASIGYAFSDGRLAEQLRDTTAALNASNKAHVILASARALIRPRRQNFYGIVGLGLVGHGGAFWKPADQSPRLGGVLGFGVRAAVSPKLSLNFSAEAYLYSFRYKSAAVPNASSKFQQDIVVSIGVPIGAR